MGAAGIEHRNIDTLIQSYQDYGYTNFAVFQGKRLCIKYEGGNTDEAINQLANYLNTIAYSNTQSIYTLYVYPAECGNITSATPASGSSMFCLGLSPYEKAGSGGTVIVPAAQVSAPVNAAMREEIEKIRLENERLRDMLHREQLDSIRADFGRQIAALHDRDAEKSSMDKFFDALDRSGVKIGDIISRIVDKIGGEKKDFIVKNGTSYMSGTKAEEVEEVQKDVDMTTQKTEEGALINPYLTAEEMQLKKKDRNNLLRARIEALTNEDHDDCQTECLEILENRIGNPTVTLMMVTVACLDNDELNKVLNNLD